MAVEMMLTPGAVTSGLRPLSPVRGPPEVKLANPVKLGFVSGAAATDVAVPSATARSFPPSDAGLNGAADPLTPRNGIVTLKASPVSGLEVIGPSNGGKLVALLDRKSSCRERVDISVITDPLEKRIQLSRKNTDIIITGTEYNYCSHYNRTI